MTKKYLTAHEKLIEMGYSHEQIGDMEYYGKDAFDYICFSKTEKTYRLSIVVQVDIKLSRILTEYLEDLECEHFEKINLDYSAGEYSDEK